MMSVDRCVCCGEVIPEGTQICPSCRGKHLGYCGQCEYFTGLGDWELSCTRQRGLYRENTPACYKFKNKEKTQNE